VLEDQRGLGYNPFTHAQGLIRHCTKKYATMACRHESGPGHHMHENLANPMWAALTSTHAGFAQTSGVLKRFAPDVAPFCAVQEDGVDLGRATGLTPGEIIYFLGTVPALPAGWTVLGESAVLQMVHAGPPPDVTGSDAPALTAADMAQMLELTALVYPEFFRRRTAELGKYIGVHGMGRLRAMAGQRLACSGYREISAVCTHPDDRRQGHAGRLISQLSRDILDDGDIPFLHVSASNKSAWELYENLGFAASRELRFVKIEVGQARS
jgi:GNAT superfamily N-acetyltransferase